MGERFQTECNPERQPLSERQPGAAAKNRAYGGSPPRNSGKTLQGGRKNDRKAVDKLSNSLYNKLRCESRAFGWRNTGRWTSGV